MENGDEILASGAATTEHTKPNGKSYAAIVAENPAPNGGAAEEEQVPVAHADKSYAAVVAENPAPNGGVSKEAEKEEKAAAGTNGVTSYAAVAARAEIEDLRASKLDLEAKLAEARRENQVITAEAHLIERNFMLAREAVTLTECAAASLEKEAASLRAELERLQAAFKIEKGEHEMDTRKHEELLKELEAVVQEKLNLEQEIKALKASTAAAVTTAKDRDASPEAEAPKMEVAWQGMAAATGAVFTAAVVMVYLRLKR